ncbi:MAG TPA: HhH-GPD-type base excision DNA repair protein [Acidimicrobiia bacterium]|nr:HhH-GPD-type base excision DNA repair protein [Acidimicrobiia bacterium]
MPAQLPFTEDAAANRRLATDPLALLIGMMLDQQFPMERAFLSPHLLAQRLGGGLDAGAISSMDEDALKMVFQGPPALHRFPGSMAARCRDMCRHVAEEYGGDAGRIWKQAADGKDLLARLEALPGFGKAKARIFVGVVGKRLGAGPTGWQEYAADWPSIADVDSFPKVYQLREQKRAMKAAKKEGASG